MDAIVTFLKPFIIKIANHTAVKNLIVELLEEYVKTTDNSIDNVIVETIRELLFTPQK